MQLGGTNSTSAASAGVSISGSYSKDDFSSGTSGFVQGNISAAGYQAGLSTSIPGDQVEMLTTGTANLNEVANSTNLEVGLEGGLGNVNGISTGVQVEKVETLVPFKDVNQPIKNVGDQVSKAAPADNTNVSLKKWSVPSD